MQRPGLRRIYEMADDQAGYFTTAQGREAGISRRMLSHFVAQGDIMRVGHGLYRLVHYPAQPFEDVIAACLWAGAGAVASHETALSVYDLGDAMPAKIHITVPRPFRGRRSGVIVHHAPLSVGDRTVRDSVPVTTVPRTLLDVASTSDPSLVTRAVSEALERGLISRRGLKRLASQTSRSDAAALLAALNKDNRP